MVKKFEISIPSYKYKMKIKYTYGDNIILDFYEINSKLGSIVIHFEDGFELDRPFPLYNLNRKHHMRVRKSLVEHSTIEYKDNENNLYRNFQLYMTKLIFQVTDLPKSSILNSPDPSVNGGVLCCTILREFKRFNLKYYLREERLQKILSKVK